MSFCCRYFYDFEFLGHGAVGLMQDSVWSARTPLVRSRGRDRCFDVILETYSTVQKINSEDHIKRRPSNHRCEYNEFVDASINDECVNGSSRIDASTDSHCVPSKCRSMNASTDRHRVPQKTVPPQTVPPKTASPKINASKLSPLKLFPHNCPA